MIDLTDKNVMFFDLETTGTYWSCDAPVQIAAVVERNGEVIDSYNTLVHTTVSIKPQASAVHGIYKDNLINAPREIEALKDFMAWIKGNEVEVMIGYNSRIFDLAMLNARCEHFGIPSLFDGEVITHYDGYYDRVKLAKDKNLFNLKTILGRKWNLSAVAEVLEIDNSGAHDAFADVNMLREIWHKFDNMNL